MFWAVQAELFQLHLQQALSFVEESAIFGGLVFQLPVLHQLLSNTLNCYTTSVFVMLLYDHAFMGTKGPAGL